MNAEPPAALATPGSEGDDVPLPSGWSIADLSVLATLAETFVPAPPGDPGEATRRARLAAEALSAGLDAAQVRQLRLVLRLMRSQVASLLLAGRSAALRDVDQAGREQYLLGWASSRLPQRRSAFHAFRKLLSFLAYAEAGGAGTIAGEAGPNPRWAAIRYAPPVEEPAEIPTPIQPTRIPAAPSADVVQLEADVIIVGSGAGGGVVAAELARAGRSVLVLEAGPFVPEPEMPTDELTAFDRLYLDHGLTATWDGAISILAGSCVGGGTTINWTTCIPLSERVRAEWAHKHGIAGLDGSELESDLRVLESELAFAPPPNVPPKDGAILRGAAALGLEAGSTRRNAVDCGDCGSCGFGCRRGSKRSGLRTHLAEAWRCGARIVPDVAVRRVLLEGGRAVGVEAMMGERRIVARAPQVVVSAGALRTPVVLARSGLEHPAIGRNLRLHPVSVVAALFRDRVDMWSGTMQGARSLAFLDGPRGDGEGGFVVESAPGHPGLIALAFPWESAAAHGSMMERMAHYAPLIAITRDLGSGRVSPTTSGGVRIDYRVEPAGAEALRRGLVAMARIGRAAGAEQLVALGTPPAVLDAAAGASEAAFADYVGRLERFSFAPNRGTLFSAHQMGTARMGSDPRMHACDPSGRVLSGTRGGIVPGLYVADASLFPTAIGVNPMVTVMLLAMRVARTVAAES